VDDVIRAFDIILHFGAIGEIYNIGTNFEVSPLEVAKKLIQMFKLDYNENYYLEFYKDREFRFIISLSHPLT
jgi:UDP-glucose 4,6-dehydratase